MTKREKLDLLMQIYCSVESQDMEYRPFSYDLDGYYDNTIDNYREYNYFIYYAATHGVYRCYRTQDEAIEELEEMIMDRKESINHFNIVSNKYNDYLNLTDLLSEYKRYIKDNEIYCTIGGNCFMGNDFLKIYDLLKEAPSSMEKFIGSFSFCLNKASNKEILNESNLEDFVEQHKEKKVQNE